MIDRDSPATTEEILSAFLYNVVAGHIQYRADTPLVGFAEVLEKYDAMYEKLYDMISGSFPEDSPIPTGVLNKIDELCRFMISVGIQYGNADLILVQNTPPLIVDKAVKKPRH